MLNAFFKDSLFISKVMQSQWNPIVNCESM